MRVSEFLRTRRRFCAPVKPVITEHPPFEIDSLADFAVAEAWFPREERAQELDAITRPFIVPVRSRPAVPLSSSRATIGAASARRLSKRSIASKADGADIGCVRLGSLRPRKRRAISNLLEPMLSRVSPIAMATSRASPPIS